MPRKSEIPPVPGDWLQFDETRGFRERFWKAEHIARLAFAVVVGVARTRLRKEQSFGRDIL